MSDKCPSCGGEPMPFADVANDAFEVALDFAEDAIKQHSQDGKVPDFLGEAILSGLMQGIAAAAFSMASDNIEAVKTFLQNELDFAIENEEDSEPQEQQGSMVQ
jgi:hypothetical protein